MLTIALPGDNWPTDFAKRSGYLVPKPVQKWVTATSFASSKWAHWQPRTPEGGVILRISLGRDGLDLTDQPDDTLIDAAVELSVPNDTVTVVVKFCAVPTDSKIALPVTRLCVSKTVLAITAVSDAWFDTSMASCPLEIFIDADSTSC